MRKSQSSSHRRIDNPPPRGRSSGVESTPRSWSGQARALPGSNLVTEGLKGLARIRGRGKIVECRPEAEHCVKSATQAKRSHVRSAHVRGDTRRPKVPPGDAEHLLRAVSACDMVTSFHQRNVDGESPACDVEDFGADGIAAEQVPEERIRPGGAPPI